MRAAAARRDAAHGAVVTYSRKVFIPLTQLCRDVCHYCTFAASPAEGRANAYLTLDRGARHCTRRRRGGLQGGAVHARRQAGIALPRGARGARATRPRDDAVLSRRGCARSSFEETGLLPHLNPGLLDATIIAALRKVSVSQGIMLESAAERLCAAADLTYGSPDKTTGGAPAKPSGSPARPACPFTSGISDRHRRDARRAHRCAARAARSQRSLRPHSGDHRPELPAEARNADGRRRRRPRSTSICGPSRSHGSLFDPAMNIQAPPNLSPGSLRQLRRRGHQRLGRRVAGDARPRQSGSALAAARHAGARDRRRPARNSSSVWPSIRPMCAQLERWVDPGLRTAAPAAHRQRWLSAHRQLVAGHARMILRRPISR